MTSTPDENTEIKRGAVSNFVRQSLMGGLLIVLPVTIIVIFFKWLYQTASGFISPLTTIFVDIGFPKLLADVVVIGILVLFCFAIGNLVATRVGSWLWRNIEEMLIVRVPGYRSVREVTVQLLGKSSDSPFKRGEVALVRLYGKDVGVSVLALVTARHAHGAYTVFVPTGPNPTSGFIYVMDAELVTLRPDIRVEQLMKTVIACGAGSATLLQKHTPS